MKGASAEPWTTTRNAPSNSNIITSGASQIFFRIRINSHRSFSNSNVRITERPVAVYANSEENLAGAARNNIAIARRISGRRPGFGTCSFHLYAILIRF